ncbi:TRAP transporter small permease [Qaidamihabitans albus]|uniref:TRAP transporter small permease n=1 Tax=Qaidamihabitans albus TaxID=2795733 RepID=UPI0018F1190B|nr:TRAP transporter small permease [Qaidamihabitans albus]
MANRLWRRIVRAVNLVCAVLAGLAITAIVILVCLQIAMRSLIGLSLVWTTEATLLLLLWTVSLGISLAFAQRKQIVVDVVIAKLPPRTRRVVEVVVGLVTVYFLYILLVTAWQLMQATMLQTSPAMGLPMGYNYAALVVGAALSVLNVVDTAVFGRGVTTRAIEETT